MSYLRLQLKEITMAYENSLEFAREMDQKDPLKSYRDQFIIPQHNGEDTVYFTGNSLGLQPKSARTAINQELEDWGKYGVEGHFHAKNPWFSYHELFQAPLKELMGAKFDHEVVPMNTLTTNLHLLMVSFYRPAGRRYKILCEGKAFPSDQYALETQVKYHGYEPENAILELYPREGEHLIREEDIKTMIDEHSDEIALIMIGGVNYYTGQVFDMATVTRWGHEAGAIVGWDLAHAAGNIKLKLNEWNVDFAAWCSYKYMNSGPGSISGIFVHDRHADNKELHRFAGWWGNDPENRFKMEKGFIPAKGAPSWQLSNAPVFAMAAHKASLDLFMEVGLDNLIEKSKKLTGYLEFILNDVGSRRDDVNFEIITSTDPEKRGCQLSVLCHGQGRQLFDNLMERGVISDWREPNVIRMAPVPMYNNFEDIYRFGQKLEASLS